MTRTQPDAERREPPPTHWRLSPFVLPYATYRRTLTKHVPTHTDL